MQQTCHLHCHATLSVPAPSSKASNPMVLQAALQHPQHVIWLGCTAPPPCPYMHMVRTCTSTELGVTQWLMLEIQLFAPGLLRWSARLARGPLPVA
jgi:hypothetical protein